MIKLELRKTTRELARYKLQGKDAPLDPLSRYPTRGLTALSFSANKRLLARLCIIVQRTMPCCRVDKLLDYIKAKPADGYDAFVETLRNHPTAVGGGDKLVERTPHKMALLIVGASLKASQLDYLCKKGAFPGLRSKRSYTDSRRVAEC